MSGFSNPYLKRVVFMGTPEFAASYLKPLLQEGIPIVAVMTQEDAVSARGNKKIAPPVKRTAIEYGIPVFQPPQINRSDGFETLARWQPD
ncbi:MAG: methionyl-tRNA formyltransferase, partial [Thermotogaceae bacterium]|nr:methionyl-tRNA formyltransferase [Thermotogaceae bacterium]